MIFKRALIFIMLAVALTLAGCTRSASKAPTSENGGVEQPTSEIPFPTPVSDGNVPGQMNTAVAGGFATQTAIAMETSGQAETQNTPEATASSVPEATSVSPTATPEPTKAPTEKPESGGGETTAKCESPYTVSKGEWVWSIGRKCNIHPNSIIEANNLLPPYTLYPGNKLILPKNAPPFPSGK